MLTIEDGDIFDCGLETKGGRTTGRPPAGVVDCLFIEGSLDECAPLGKDMAMTGRGGQKKAEFLDCDTGLSLGTNETIGT